MQEYVSYFRYLFMPTFFGQFGLHVCPVSFFCRGVAVTKDYLEILTYLATRLVFLSNEYLKLSLVLKRALDTPLDYLRIVPSD